MTLRAVLAHLLLTASAVMAGPVQAQSYPAQPVRIIVPFAPGGTVDMLGRLIAQHIAKPLGQSVVVENRPGAGSAVGTDFVAKASPDGYTLLMASTSSMAVNPNLQKLPYQLSNFAPIALVASVPHVIVVHPGVPAANFREFVAHAKRIGSISYATAGVGTPQHLGGALLGHLAGLTMVDIPYKGTGPALADVVGGQVPIMSVDLPPALPFIANGRIRALGVAAKSRSPFAPDIPTMAEAGLPNFEVTGWYGIVAPAGVPKAVVEKLSSAIVAAMAQPEFKEKLSQIGATPEGLVGPEFGDFMQRESVKWATVIRTANIKVE